MSPEQTALENVLADMFREVSTAGRIADMAGLDVAQVDRTGSSADVWHSILTMAIQDNVVDALIERAQVERPRNKELPAAYQNFVAAAPPDRRPTRRPPRGQDGDRLSDYRQDERRDARIDQMQRDMASIQIQMAGLVVQVAQLNDLVRAQNGQRPSLTNTQFSATMLAFVLMVIVVFVAVYYGGNR